MSISAIKLDATAVDVSVTSDRLIVILADGRELSAPLAWFPRLSEATDEERRKWRLIGRGQGIHWPQLDEDVSVASLLRAIAFGGTAAHRRLALWAHRNRRDMRPPGPPDRADRRPPNALAHLPAPRQLPPRQRHDALQTIWRPAPT
jgi:hypothetical protein